MLKGLPSIVGGCIEYIIKVEEGLHRPLLTKALSPMEVVVAGKESRVKLEHSIKALSPMRVTVYCMLLYSITLSITMEAETLLLFIPTST